MSNKKIKIIVFLALVFLIGAFFVGNKKEMSLKGGAEQESILEKDVLSVLFSELRTNLSNKSINLDLILPGGPGKDGIPALSDPIFLEIEDSEEKDESLGIFVEVDGDKRFYPYSIMVWHEIVNDVVGGKPLAITFCPLCGSAIVFEREIEGDIFEFGVSGLLYESNLLMYDKETESLWSQALGEAVVGDLTGEALPVGEMQLITFGELKNKHPDSLVLSRKTGYFRNYDRLPYSGYNTSSDTFFPVSVRDERFFAKEIMYVIPFDGKWFAFPEKKLEPGITQKQTYNSAVFEVRRDGGEIYVFKGNQRIPGYFEMWFSFAVHHQEDGIIWNFD